MYRIYGYLENEWKLLDETNDFYDACILASNHCRNLDSEEMVKIFTPEKIWL